MLSWDDHCANLMVPGRLEDSGAGLGKTNQKLVKITPKKETSAVFEQTGNGIRACAGCKVGRWDWVVDVQT